MFKKGRALSVATVSSLFLGAINAFAVSEPYSAGNETVKTAYDRLTVENVPACLAEDLGLNSRDIIGISSQDYHDLSSVVTINGDGTETLFMFGQPVKYIDNETGEVRFIDNAIEETSKFRKSELITIDFINDANQLKIIVANPIKDKLKPKKIKTRGFGLLLAYDLAKYHKKINIHTEIVNGYYIQHVIYNKK